LGFWFSGFVLAWKILVTVTLQDISRRLLNPALCALHILLVSYVCFTAEQTVTGHCYGSKDSKNTIFAIANISYIPYIADAYVSLIYRLL
jgi:hypothetical protein